MKIKLFLFIFILLLSCSSDDIQEEFISEETVKNKIELKLNGIEPVNSIRNLTASFCCNNNISVSFEHMVSTANGLGYGGSAFNLTLDKNGNLLSLWYKDYTHPNNEFYSPYFTPTSTIEITNFELIENQHLKVTLNGKIFKKTHNFFTEPEFVLIDANIVIKDFSQCICGSYVSNITNSNGLIFHRITRTQQGSDIRYFAHSNNGYHIEFINFNEYIRNMPLGVYEFNETSTNQRVDFRKFVGIPRAFIYLIIPQEWLKFETSGSFEILNRQQIGNELVTTVKINFVAKNNNEIIYEFNNVILKTQM